LTAQPFLIPAVLIALLAIPLILGVVPPNRIYGVRTRRTLSDARVWYAANRAGGWLLLAASVVYLLVAALAPYAVAPRGRLLWALHLLGFLAPLLLGFLLLRRYL
jgi:uncharacterized membrane protein